MTERSPAVPFQLDMYQNNIYTNPNPRTVRGSDMTWFNTRGNNIIKTDYNSEKIESHMYPWGEIPEPKHTPFNLQGWGKNGKCDLFTRFDLYGVKTK